MLEEGLLEVPLGLALAVRSAATAWTSCATILNSSNCDRLCNNSRKCLSLFSSKSALVTLSLLN